MRKILSVVTGVVAGIAIVFVGDATIHAINPPPVGLNYLDKNVMVAYVAGIPTYVLVIMLLFWMLSSFTGGLLAGWINRPEWKSSAMITGGILLAAAVLNMVLVSHPLWIWIAALVLYLPSAMLGGWLVNRNNVPKVPAA